MGDGHLPTRQQDSSKREPPGLAEHRQWFPTLGQRLLDRYEIFGVRRGELFVVFFVTDLETNQDYAVKTYRPEFADFLPTVEQFKAEVSFWINLEPHPNIVKAYFIQVIDDQPYLFMEYVSGGAQTNLREWMRTRPFGAPQAIPLVYQLCLGMEFANRKGEIAHLDLKPENILINKKATLKVTDFGLAHRVRTIQGQYPRMDAGTWPYTAPQRFNNQAEDCRSDVYAFGVILYEMVTGKLPYPFQLDKDPQIQFEQLANFHAGQGAADLSEDMYYHGVAGVDLEGVGIVISGCMSHFPSRRYRNFTVLREILESEFNLTPPKYAITPSPSDDDLHSQALALYRIGRYSEALSLFNRLLQQRPDEGRLWLDVALALLANGQARSAHYFLERALRLDPTLEEARRLLCSGE